MKKGKSKGKSKGTQRAIKGNSFRTIVVFVEDYGPIGAGRRYYTSGSNIVLFVEDYGPLPEV